MPFSITEIRDRAKELKKAIAFEQYSSQAGLKERLPSEKLYKQPPVPPRPWSVACDSTSFSSRKLG